VNNTSTFKFIITPVPFTSLWRSEAGIKTWAGFSVEKATLLDAFQSIPNIVLISGDGPEFATVQFNTPEQQNAIWEFTRNPRSLRYLPFQRTLHMSSAEATRKATFGIEEVVETENLVPREQVIKHISNGSFKWFVVPHFLNFKRLASFVG
jgi:alkaline phosphatase D